MGPEAGFPSDILRKVPSSAHQLDEHFVQPYLTLRQGFHLLKYCYCECAEQRYMHEGFESSGPGQLLFEVDLLNRIISQPIHDKLSNLCLIELGQMYAAQPTKPGPADVISPRYNDLNGRVFPSKLLRKSHKAFLLLYCRDLI